MTGWHWFGTPEGAAALIVNAYGECPHEVMSWPPTCQRCAVDLIRAAVEIERARAVDFLLHGPWWTGIKTMASAIERGEHRA